MSDSLGTKARKRKQAEMSAKAARSETKRLRIDLANDIKSAQLVEEVDDESASAVPRLEDPVVTKAASALQRFIVFIGMAGLSRRASII